MADLHFTIRNLQMSSLEGAFRVHIDQGALTRLGLKLEDLCQITSEEGTTGLGIAWRAAEKGMGNSPKMQPVKLSETLRETFGFESGKPVKIEKSGRSILPAAKVVLTDVTPSDYDGTDDESWDGRCRMLLRTCIF
jgi:AAA family ATPase